MKHESHLLSQTGKLNQHTSLRSIHDPLIKNPNEHIYDPEKDVTFWLHQNSKEHQVIKYEESIFNSTFDENALGTRIIIGGWLAGPDSFLYNSLRDAYLSRDNLNVIVVDWGIISKQGYLIVRKYVEPIGKQIAQFIDRLVRTKNVSHNSFYVIGHSVAAHIAGFAGKHTSQKINTIFGLDPTAIMFPIDKPEQRLTSTDAQYVEVIHTESRLYGYWDPLGHADFYANYGVFQPGCTEPTCSHLRAVDLLAESIMSDDAFDSLECPFVKIQLKNCETEDEDDEIVRMGGEPSNQDEIIRGEFYFKTNSKAPYANIKE